MNALELRFTCRGEGAFALRVDTQLPGSGITAIYGPSGGGKTTLLDCIAGLRATEEGGLIRFDGRTWLDAGRNVPPWQREVGYVFNDARLFPHLSVEGNLRYAGRRRRGGGGTVDADFDGLVRMLELGALLAQRPDTLSAGQRQRAAIARALLGGPRLLLLDEPLANLDAAASRHCLHCLQRLADELALPMLYVSHDIEEVSELADHLLLLEDGGVVEQGPLLDLCGRLDNRLSREESAAAILAASVSGHDEAYGLTALDVEGERLYVNHLPQPPGTRRRVRIPARDVSVCRTRPRDSSILNILPVTVEEIEPGDSPRPMLRLGLGTQHLLARITRKSAAALELRAGDTVYAQIKSAALLMDAADQP